MTQITVKQLLEAGTHYGHQTHRWNPKMAPYIFGERKGLHIIDLAKTLQLIKKALAFIEEKVKQGSSILFVGTKKQAKFVIAEQAQKCGEFYISERWLGGTLTNLETIRKSVDKLKLKRKLLLSGAEEGLTKKEMGLLEKNIIKLERNLSGVVEMKKLPGLLVVVDPGRERIAVAEARKLKIPVVALIDTNSNPDVVDYVIPGNDDAMKSVQLIIEEIVRVISANKTEEIIQKEQASEGELSADSFTVAESSPEKQNETAVETAPEQVETK